MYNFEMNGYLWKQKGVWNSLGIIEMRITFGKLQVWFHLHLCFSMVLSLSFGSPFLVLVWCYSTHLQYSCVGMQDFLILLITQ